MNEDDLYRSAVANAVAAEEDLSKLSAYSSADLFAALAERTRSATMGMNANGFGTPINIDDLPRDGATSDLGRRIFRRWSRAFHQFICTPDRNDSSARDRLVRALTGKESCTAVIAGMLVASFGASPAVAAVVAALLLKLIFDPAKAEVCETWGTWLEQNQ
jgi:hypothetical protein